MVDGDAVEPGADGGLPAKLIQPPEGLEEDIMRGVLRLLRIGEKTEREVINRPAVLLINAGELRHRPTGGGGRRRFNILTGHRLVHDSFHR